MSAAKVCRFLTTTCFICRTPLFIFGTVCLTFQKELLPLFQQNFKKIKYESIINYESRILQIRKR